ncbi:MAG: MarR family winged helix-turn-helix transcriptional regulator [Candidatus Aquicultor sp.]
MDKEQITERAHELQSAMNMFRRTNFITKDDSGLRHSEKYFMWLLATLNKGEPVMPSEAAKVLNVTLAAITHHINSLEKQGYVTRSSSPEDRRVVFVSLSDKGAEMVAAMRKSHFEKMYGLVDYLGDKDSAELLALMAKIAEYMKNKAHQEKE